MNTGKWTAAVMAGLMLGPAMCLPPAMYGETPALSVAQAAERQATAVVDSRVKKVTKNRHVTTYPSIRQALAGLAGQKADSYLLQLKPGTYREKVTVALPNLTMAGEDAATTCIVWNDAEGTPLRPGDTHPSGKTTYTMECATVKITPAAKNFQAVNLTFANDFPTEARRADKTMKAVQAFAVTDEADCSSFYQCRFLGRQDTLYANAGRQYYRDCYIEGDVDFIFGQASAAVFESCEIRSLARAVKQDGKAHSMGYVTAPSTLAQDKGYLFYRCHLTSDIPAPHYAMLGRPWHPSSEQREVSSAAAFRECQIDTPMKEKAWNSMKNKYGVFQPEDNRLYEYRNTGRGARTGGNRRQLTDAEAELFTPAAFLGDWKPARRA